jgi:hypothetical protein
MAIGETTARGEGLEDDGMHEVRYGTLLLSTLVWLSQSRVAPVFPAQVAVYFSPHGGVTGAVVRELTAAQCQCYPGGLRKGSPRWPSGEA